MIIYLVRHGEGLSRQGMPVKQGNTVALSAWGRVQAAALGRYFAGKNIAAVVSSPIMRTKETAEVIAAAVHVQIIFDERLKEWEKTEEEPHVARARMIEALRSLKSEGDVCVISHERVIQMFLHSLFGKDYAIGLASITALEYKNSHYKLLFVNKKLLLWRRIYRRLVRN